jgi:hypothetical protein
MRIPSLLVGALAGALVLVACREADGPIGPVTGGVRMVVSSSPQGGRIFVDDRDTGMRTPDTIAGLSGTHTINVRLDSAGIRYEYIAQIAVGPTDSLLHLHGPLAVICSPAEVTACHGRLHRYQDAAGMRFAWSPLGSLFLRQGQGHGLLWPQNSSNSYISGAMPVVAARLPGGVVSLGIYDHIYLAGRPAPVVSTSAAVFRLAQETWVWPPTSTLRRSLTARGLSVRQEVLAASAAEGVILVKLTFRNITADPEYQVVEVFLGPNGATFEETYIGLAVDPDIGVAEDDWLSYDPELAMVYAYDARFQEQSFTGEGTSAPALVGLRAVRVPAGAGVVLNGWTQSGQTADWRAGTASEVRGYDMLSGENPTPPVHPDRRIGHLPPGEGDVRISVTAGPLRLAPGDSAQIVLALVVAPPQAGTYQSGQLVHPGEPTDTTRQLHRVAERLRARARQAESLLDL